MDESQDNCTEDKVRAEIKKFGYWKIDLRPETDTKLSIEECKDIFHKSQIRHYEWAFPLTSRNMFKKKDLEKNYHIKDYGYDEEYIMWWIFYTNGSFKIELRIRDKEKMTNIERVGHNTTSNTSKKLLPPINKDFEPKIILHQLIEMEQFTINLSYYLKKKYYMNIDLCNMKDKHLRTHMEDDYDDVSMRYENNRLLIDNKYPINFKCEVDEIRLEKKNVSANNLEHTFVLKHIRYIYNKFNHHGITRVDFDDTVKKQIKNYFNKESDIKERHNFIPKD